MRPAASRTLSCAGSYLMHPPVLTMHDRLPLPFQLRLQLSLQLSLLLLLPLRASPSLLTPYPRR